MKSTYQIIQITDTHLFSDPDKTLRGYCTHANLVKTIDHILLNATSKPDFVFVTGDISEDESAQSYLLALAQFERLDCPVYWIHGNHDNAIVLKPIFDRSQRVKNLINLSIPSWEFISINTCRYGSEKGYIASDEYDRFLLQLAEVKNKQVAVVMHHHPIPVNTPLLDACMLQDYEQFLNITKQHKEIKLVICGHVHGDYKVMHDDLLIEVSPATCFQWKKGTSEVETENVIGYKIFNFDGLSFTSSAIFI
jgi:Icc protein